VRPILLPRQSVSSLSAISNRGRLRFMVLKKAVDAPTLITHLPPSAPELNPDVI
jgi:hypothetical protein